MSQAKASVTQPDALAMGTCPATSPPREKTVETPAPDAPLGPEDFYMENGFVVFTAAYHLRRGYCCNSGCRHCPYQDVEP